MKYDCEESSLPFSIKLDKVLHQQPRYSEIKPNIFRVVLEINPRFSNQQQVSKIICEASLIQGVSKKLFSDKSNVEK